MIAVGVAVAALTALALTLFGSSGDNVLDPVAQAATRSAQAPGYRMLLRLDFAASSAPEAATAVAHGIIDTRDRAVSMSMAMRLPNASQVVQQLGSETLRIDMILSGGRLYTKLPAAATGQLSLIGKRWIAFDLSKAGPSLSSLGGNPMSSDPSQMLQYMRAVSDSVVAEGNASVDGFKTTHYRATLDLSKVLSALPSQDRTAVQRALSAMQRLGVSTIPVDVWVDATRLVRRVRMALDIHGPSGQNLSETMTEDLFDYGPQPKPTPPPSDQVASVGALPRLGG